MGITLASPWGRHSSPPLLLSSSHLGGQIGVTASSTGTVDGRLCYSLQLRHRSSSSGSDRHASDVGRTIDNGPSEHLGGLAAGSLVGLYHPIYSDVWTFESLPQWTKGSRAIPSLDSSFVSSSCTVLRGGPHVRARFCNTFK